MAFREEDWRALEHLLETDEELQQATKDLRDEMLDLTAMEDEHPEWYNSACYCNTCMEAGL